MVSAKRRKTLQAAGDVEIVEQTKPSRKYKNIYKTTLFHVKYDQRFYGVWDRPSCAKVEVMRKMVKLTTSSRWGAVAATRTVIPTLLAIVLRCFQGALWDQGSSIRSLVTMKERSRVCGDIHNIVTFGIWYFNDLKSYEVFSTTNVHACAGSAPWHRLSLILTIYVHFSNLQSSGRYSQKHFKAVEVVGRPHLFHSFFNSMLLFHRLVGRYNSLEAVNISPHGM